MMRLILEIEIGDLLAVGIFHDEGFLTFFDRRGQREAAGHRPSRCGSLQGPKKGKNALGNLVALWGKADTVRTPGFGR
jgi:hypothetical protein